MARKIYLAGPDVFLPNAVEVGRRKREFCRQHGFEGLFPLDKEDEVGADPAEIFAANCGLMRAADIGLVNLTPFRGPSADPGTVFEIGYMFAMGKPLLGYTSNPDNLLARVRVTHGLRTDGKGRKWDRDNLSVEDFDLTDNLMIDEAILKSGGSITRVAEQGEGALAAFRGFEVCLASVRSALGGSF